MRYALEYRPASIGAVPPGYLAVEPSDLPEARHGVIVYDPPLRPEDARAYELRPIADALAIEQMVQQVADATRYPTQLLELWDEGQKTLVCSMLGSGFERLFPDRPVIGDRDAFMARIVERLRACGRSA